jgi:hypothetical protein
LASSIASSSNIPSSIDGIKFKNFGASNPHPRELSSSTFRETEVFRVLKNSFWMEAQIRDEKLQKNKQERKRQQTRRWAPLETHNRIRQYSLYWIYLYDVYSMIHSSRPHKLKSSLTVIDRLTFSRISRKRSAPWLDRARMPQILLLSFQECAQDWVVERKKMLQRCEYTANCRRRIYLSSIGIVSRVFWILFYFI